MPRSRSTFLKLTIVRPDPELFVQTFLIGHSHQVAPSIMVSLLIGLHQKEEYLGLGPHQIPRPIYLNHRVFVNSRTTYSFPKKDYNISKQKNKFCKGGLL